MDDSAHRHRHARDERRPGRRGPVQGARQVAHAAQTNAIKAELKARQDAIKRRDRRAAAVACSPSSSPPTTASRSRSARKDVAGAGGPPERDRGSRCAGAHARQRRRACRSWACRQVWQDHRASPATASRSPSSTPASTTRTPTSAAPVRSRPTRPPTRPTRRSAADDGIFGPTAPKVKGGIDLVGDAYDGGTDRPAALIPHARSARLPVHERQRRPRLARLGHRDGLRRHSPTAARTTGLRLVDTRQRFTIGPGVAPGPTSTSSASSAATARPR